MSEDELVSAYSAGRISRRVFVRRLMITGMSAGAALLYARSLAPSAAAAAPMQAKEVGHDRHKDHHEDHHKDHHEHESPVEEFFDFLGN